MLHSLPQRPSSQLPSASELSSAFENVIQDLGSPQSQQSGPQSQNSPHFPKVYLEGPHDYGITPSKRGALNYARDAAINRALPYYKQLLHAERGGPGHKVAYIIRLATPTLLFLGLITSFIAFYLGITTSSAYGMQSVLVDSISAQITDPEAYKFKANTAPTMQQWAIRAGEWGTAQTITLNLPDANKMKNDALVFVRNTSTESYNHIANPVSVNDYTASIQVKGPEFTHTLAKRESSVYISAKDANGVQRWYPALLMSGAI